MRGNVKRVLGCAGVVLAVLLCLWALGGLLARKDSDIKYHGFFAQQADFDVLFVGGSHMNNGIYPMELWADHGIVSYNLGGQGGTIPTAYWVLKNALRYTTPRLVVIDGFALEIEQKVSGNYTLVHKSFDAFPLSWTKIQAVTDLLDDPATEELIRSGELVEAEKRTPMGLLWNFSVYHSRWNELDKNDFAPAYSVEKGAEREVDVAVPAQVPPVADTDILTEETTAMRYLRRLIEECQAEGIDVLLTFLPFPAEEVDQRAANTLYGIAEEYGVPYLNFLRMDVVNYDTDCYDPAAHLNPSGAYKVTAWLGDYIARNYAAVPDRRQDAAYADWAGDYDAYRQEKADTLRIHTDLNIYLMLLADADYDVLLQWDDAALAQNPVTAALLQNLGLETIQPGLYVRPGGQPARQAANGCATALGTLQTKDGAVLLNGSEVWPQTETGQQAALRIAVWEKNGTLVDKVTFPANSRTAQR